MSYYWSTLCPSVISGARGIEMLTILLLFLTPRLKNRTRMRFSHVVTQSAISYVVSSFVATEERNFPLHRVCRPLRFCHEPMRTDILREVYFNSTKRWSAWPPHWTHDTSGVKPYVSVLGDIPRNECKGHTLRLE